MLLREKLLAEYYLLDKLEKKGWQFVKSTELDRESLEEPLLIKNLIKAIGKINREIKIGDKEITQVLNELRLKGSGIEGAKRILNFYKAGVPIKLEKEGILERVKLFDYEKVENNEFIISNQVYHKGKEMIRTDIILYVNGIPLVNVECKDPTNPSQSWLNAYKDIKEYEQLVPELYKYCQIGVAAEYSAKYFPIVPWEEDVEIYEWREETKDSLDSIIEMLSPSTLLDIIRNFLFVEEKFGRVRKVIARYVQYRATNAICQRVIRNLKGEENKNKGLVWHWQGSGKTLTMIFTGQKLFSLLKNPTIFFVVDRDELQEQLYENFCALDIPRPERPISSVEELKEVLRHDDYRGKRGFFITLIHKFRPEELRDLGKELAEISQKKETIQNRKDVIVLIDEGDRTQYGVLASEMRKILSNAFFFAFTGTPISQRGRDTYLEFAYPPEEKYLDKYFIADSIEDGFTVKIAYQPRLLDLHLKEEDLDAFLKSEYEELPDEIREGIEAEVKRRLENTKLVLENPERIKRIAQDVAEYFREYLDERFKALLVCASRKACVLYKKELDKILPQEYSEVVMTFTPSDSEEIRNYYEEWKERYKGKGDDEIREEIRRKFKEEAYPKILIVTDMLLRGFDCPILQTMFLDKPLREHRLLQAVARTNRPYKDLKTAGMVLDYIGILKDYEKALAIYSREEIKGIFYDLFALQKEFNTLLDQLLNIFPEKDELSREKLTEALEVITEDGEKEKVFLEKYKRLRKLFELLGPNIIKAERLSEYKWLSALYRYYKGMVGGEEKDYEEYEEKYFKRTIESVHKATEVKELIRELPIIAFDENYLRNLEGKAKGIKEKAAALLFTLNKLVLVERTKNPIYESLMERVKRLLELWREKTKDYEKIYQESVRIVGEIENLRHRQQEIGFSDLEYALLLGLEEKCPKGENLVEDVQELSQILKPFLFPGWLNLPTHRREVERELRRFVRKKRPKWGIEKIDEVVKILWERIINYAV